MSASFLVTFSKGGKTWPLLDATNEGGLKFDEPTPYWRSFSFSFGTDNAATDAKWQTIREALGLPLDAFVFDVTPDSGGMRLSGPEGQPLPSGDYWIRAVFLEDETLTLISIWTWRIRCRVPRIFSSIWAKSQAAH